MPRVRIKYGKGTEIRFISHRDLCRTFERAIRRANLPIAYSQGFNPHMKISWGPARKVGATAQEEFAELQFEQWLKPHELKERLNQQLPKGLEVVDAYLV